MPGFRPYPVALNVQGKPCLVVGGGAVARRKVEDLVRSGAVVTVVAPRIDAAISSLPPTDITLIKREFRPEDAADKLLVFACTHSPALNAWIGETVRAAGGLFNRSDEAGDCDFAGMSTIERGSLLIAVTTGSESPAFARWMREEISSQIGPEYGELLEIAASLRDEVKQKVSSEHRSAAWQRAFKSDALTRLRSSDRDGAVDALQRALFGTDRLG